MPFSKWNLEPVYVSRTPPWHQQQHQKQQQNGLISTGNGGDGTKSDKGGDQPHQQGTTSTKATSPPSPTFNFLLPSPPQPSSGKKQKRSHYSHHPHRNHHHPRLQQLSENDENCSPNSVKHTSSSNSSPPKAQSPPPVTGSGDDVVDIYQKDPSTSTTARETAILLSVSCRSLVGILRQLAALVGAGDQLFAEVTEDCRRLVDRSVALRARVVRLSGTVDRANAALRLNPPQIINLMAELDAAEADKMDRITQRITIYGNNPSNPNSTSSRRIHWRSVTPLDGDLLRPETRPLAVRNVYARAHAPGDLRLASHCHSGAGYPSPFITMLRCSLRGGNQGQNSRHNPSFGPFYQNQSLISSSQKCQCSCGQCHQQNNLVKEVKEPSNACNRLQSDGQMKHPTSNRNSSPSSLVTWSSVVSSSAFESSMALEPTSRTKKPTGFSGPRRNLLSSFSSADYDAEEEEDEEELDSILNSDPKTKIDDFFRKNNVSVKGVNGPSSLPSPSSSKCTCSCSHQSKDESGQQGKASGYHLQNHQNHHQLTTITDDDEMTTSTSITSITDRPSYSQTTSGFNKVSTGNSEVITEDGCSSTASLIRNGGANSSSRANYFRSAYGQDQDSYWNWWWSDDEHRRWSSAMSSPLKPAKTDEMSVWMRENIETRRPESVVFKSASDVPNHVLLERALSPPCSSHEIVLRPKKARTKSSSYFSEDENPKEEVDSSTLPRLKRRWSLFPLRRKSQQNSKSMVISGPIGSVVVSSGLPGQNVNQNPQNLTRLTQNRQSLPPLMTSKEGRKTEGETKNSEKTSENGGGDRSPEVTEVLLMSPEERVKLLAGQFSAPVVVPIDTSGRGFKRMSSGRRSLIHYDFHIPRRHISSTMTRSRSKSPVKNMGTMTMDLNNSTSTSNSKEVSPYALSGRLPDHHPHQGLRISKPKPVAERGCQTEEGEGDHLFQSPTKHLFKHLTPPKGDVSGSGNRYEVAVEVHHLQFNSPPHHQNGLLYNEKEEDDENDPYVTLMRRGQIDDSSTVTNSDIKFNRSSKVGSWRKVAKEGSGEKVVPNGTLESRGSGSNQTITVRYRGSGGDDQARKGVRQNGGRSSSGNWSAATSDLLQSSSTSSSPLAHHLTSVINSKKSSPNYVEKSPKIIKECSKSKESKGDDEAESVYSVDNDGYFTSMHTDSGLFFGHTPLTGLDNLVNQKKASNFKLPLTKKKSSDHRLLNQKGTRRFERIQEEPGKGVQTQTTDQSKFGGSNESINSILSNSDATSVLEEDLGGVHRNGGSLGPMTLLSPVDDTASSMADFDCSVSHCSHQYATTGGRGHHGGHQGGRSFTLGHRAHHRAELEEKRRLTAAAIQMMHQRQNQNNQQTANELHHPHPRLRTVSGGTFNDDDDDETLRSSSSNATLNTTTADDGDGHHNHHNYQQGYHSQHFDTTRTRVKRSSSYRSANYGGNFRSATLNLPAKNSPEQAQNQKSGSFKSGQLLSTTSTSGSASTSVLRRQVSNLTESGSSASSSYRRLPPPPPPPRVSSMLVKLQQYRDDGQQFRKLKRSKGKGQQSDEETEDLDSIVSLDGGRSSVTNGHDGDDLSEIASSYTHQSNHSNHFYGGHLKSESEMSTNSEYLASRRRNLLLNVVDSARSYPPLSYDIAPYDDSSIYGGNSGPPYQLGSSDVDRNSIASSRKSSNSTFDQKRRFGGAEVQDTLELESIPFADDGPTNLGEKTSSEMTKSEDTLCSTTTATSSRTVTPEDDNEVNMAQSEEGDEGENLNSNSNNYGTLERKQLEERHLSSPLPQPKLASLARMSKSNGSSSLKKKNGPLSPSILKSTSIVEGSDFDGGAKKEVTSSPSTPPKPKPRNSLYFTPETSSPTMLESFSKTSIVDTKPSQSNPKSPPTSAKKSVTINLPSPSATTFSKTSSTDSSHSPQSTTSSNSSHSSSAAPLSPSGNQISLSSPGKGGDSSTSTTSPLRRLTTEDLFIILHNQKKKLNIKTEPAIFTSTRSPPPPTSSSTTSPLTSPGHPFTQSPSLKVVTSTTSTFKTLTTSPTFSSPSPSAVTSIATSNSTTSPSSGIVNPTYGQLGSPPGLSSSLKRRSWTGNDAALGGGKTSTNGSLGSSPATSGAPRTRQSLALDRLGPMRPTTLSDFKRLLANVRPTSTSTSSPLLSPNSGRKNENSTSASTSASSSIAGTPISGASLSSSTSTYSALQQLLKGNNGNNDNISNSNTTSGVSSLISPLSPTTTNNTMSNSSSFSSPFSSPSRGQQKESRIQSPPLSTPSNTNMTDFIKKFSSKSKSSSTVGKSTSGSYVSAKQLLSVSSNSNSANSTSCPPILEDEVDDQNAAVSVGDGGDGGECSSSQLSADSVDSAVDLTTSQTMSMSMSTSEVIASAAKSSSVDEDEKEVQKKIKSTSLKENICTSTWV